MMKFRPNSKTGCLVLCLAVFSQLCDHYASAESKQSKKKEKEEAEKLSDEFYSKFDEMVTLEGGTFTMGTNDVTARDGESPSRRMKVDPFMIQKYPVTNSAFRKFVRDTSWQSAAEHYGWSFVFQDDVPEEIQNEIPERIPNAPWWIPVKKAYWRQPEGKGSSISDRLHYPAIHMSYLDAEAYCDWKGWRLPSEAEWEFAARGGLRDVEYPWGDEYNAKRLNIWTGKFPEKNDEADGYVGVAPVNAYIAQNKYDLYDMVGNVWEWTSTEYATHPSQNPVERPTIEDGTKLVLRGGSFVDSSDGSFNHFARVTTRMGNEADAGSNNIGFRCAKSVSKQKSKAKNSTPNKENNKKEEL